MRISTTMMFKNYTNLLESKTGDVQKYSDEVSSGMKFQRASDDPVAALETMKNCHEYVDNQQYQSSYSSTSVWMQNTETTMNQLNSIIKSVEEKLTEAANGTNNSEDDADNATAFENYRQEIVTTLNTQIDGQYVFGKGATGTAPFAYTAASGLQFYDYNGGGGYISVSGMTAGQVTSEKLSSAVDLGLGIQIQMSGTTTGLAPVEGTYFQAATSGLDAIVAGYDATSGKATDIVDALRDTVSALQSGDNTTTNSCLSVAQQAQSAVSKVTVDIGERSNMLTFVSSTLTANETNIVSGLSNSMDADTTESAMNYTLSMTVYKASLSVASSALQESLIDFLK